MANHRDLDSDVKQLERSGRNACLFMAKHEDAAAAGSRQVGQAARGDSVIGKALAVRPNHRRGS